MWSSKMATYIDTPHTPGHVEKQQQQQLQKKIGEKHTENEQYLILESDITYIVVFKGFANSNNKYWATHTQQQIAQQDAFIHDYTK